MYLRILKKDLKHNRAMNIILLVFILLAATFVSSSANNILTVMNARDRFFEMSGMDNYFIMTKGVDADTLDSTISGLEHYESCHIEPVIFLSKDDASVKGIAVENAPNLSLYPMEKSALNYFGTDNAPVDPVARGKILLPVKLLDNNDIEVGDTFTVTLGDTEMDFTVAGFVKDALLGSPNVGTTRVLISQEDFVRLYEAPVVEEQLRYGALASITTSESTAFANEFMDSGISTVLMADENMVSAMYILDMAVAAVLLVVSFCLVDGFGEYNGLKVGGPGCVGTIPSCRKQGIGLKMVQNATVILQREGYDISHIHYTGVGPWYAHMGYKVILRWNGKGFVK